MKKILMICLYLIAALLVVFAFLHFSYIIKYDNVDGFIKIENQNIIIYIVILFYVIILLPLFLRIKNYVIAIKKYN